MPESPNSKRKKGQDQRSRSKDSERERMGSSGGGLVIMEQTFDANNLFNAVEAQQYLNSAWQDVIEQVGEKKNTSQEEPKIQVYRSQEKAWTSNSKPGLPPALDFVSELQKAMNQ